MKKITLSLIGIIAKLFAFSVPLKNSEQLLSKDSSGMKRNKRLENNGERWLHILPQSGESFLGFVLFQFELERAKALALA